MRTIDKIITNVSSRRGAPMGRSNEGKRPKEVLPDMSDITEKDTYLFNVYWILRKKRLNKNIPKIYDCAVPMCTGYDKGGAYWGIGAQLRVAYTKDLSYIQFYRKGQENW